MTDQIADAASRYLYEAGGKRVRPMLALITAQLGDGANENVILGATALEMTHLGTLYHDDVMDAADKRRGVPSAHAVWGNSVAILTGDLLFSRASQIMAKQGDRAIRLQADTFERLVLGQMHETVGPAGRRGPRRVLPQGARRQDRLAHRGRRAVGHHLLERTGRVRAAARGVRREGRGRLPAARRRDRPLRRPRRDRQGARHRPARRRADDAVPGARTADGCRIRSPSARASTTGVERIAAGADPAILDAELAELREHEATQATLDLAHAWSNEAVAGARAPSRWRGPRGADALRAGRRGSIQLSRDAVALFEKSASAAFRDTKGPS